MTTLPAARLANRFGKRVVLPIGAASIFALGISLFVASDARLGYWYIIFPILIVYGVGRGIWVRIIITLCNSCCISSKSTVLLSSYLLHFNTGTNHMVASLLTRKK
jgi:hypothetical protein